MAEFHNTWTNIFYIITAVVSAVRFGPLLLQQSSASRPEPLLLFGAFCVATFMTGVSSHFSISPSLSLSFILHLLIYFQLSFSSFLSHSPCVEILE